MRVIRFPFLVSSISRIEIFSRKKTVAFAALFVCWRRFIFSSVNNRMFGWRNNLKIIDRIIQFVPINVVNMFVLFQGAPNGIFNYYSMFKNSFPMVWLKRFVSKLINIKTTSTVWSQDNVRSPVPFIPFVMEFAEPKSHIVPLAFFNRALALKPNRSRITSFLSHVMLRAKTSGHYFCLAVFYRAYTHSNTLSILIDNINSPMLPCQI